MNNKFKLFIITVVAVTAISSQGFSQNTPVIPKTTQQVAKSAVYPVANSLDMVNHPSRYLNRVVTVKGKFDKFSTLGLDYKPALRKSDEYITFLIQREDVKDHNVPLSELKVFLKRTEAEKHIDLSAGDEIEFSGKVFSTALGDIWMDAEQFNVIYQKKQDKK